MRFQHLIRQPLLTYKFNQLIEGSIPNSSLQVDDRLNIDREFWSQVIYKAYTCERRLAQKVPQNPGYNSFFLHVDLLFSHVQGVHLANTLQVLRKDVVSIYTSLASCEHYDWSVLVANFQILFVRNSMICSYKSVYDISQTTISFFCQKAHHGSEWIQKHIIVVHSNIVLRKPIPISNNNKYKSQINKCNIRNYVVCISFIVYW